MYACVLFCIVSSVTSKETFDGSLYKINWNEEPANEEILKGHDVNVIIQPSLIF